MIQATNNNPSFRARFRFNGTESETSAFVRFIKAEIKESNKPDSALSLVKKGGDTFVLTATDAQVGCTGPTFLDAAKFYDPKKQNFLKGIIGFNPIRGCYEKLHSRIEDGITLYSSTIYYKTPEIKLNRHDIRKADFNKEIPLIEALDKVKDIPRVYAGFHNLNIYKEAVMQNKKLKNMNVSGLSDSGLYSVVFKTKDDKTLKLSLNPCYPEETKDFDLPILDKGFIPLENKTVYYLFNAKKTNHYDKKFNRSDVRKIIEMIEKDGKHKTDDIDSNDYRQIVMDGDTPYLCDYQCAKLPNGESRLVKRKLD